LRSHPILLLLKEFENWAIAQLSFTKKTYCNFNMVKQLNI
jgi:hypothetical protein